MVVPPKGCNERSARDCVAVGAKARDCPDPRNHKLHRLEENIGAADVELSPEHLCTINEAVSKITGGGCDRYR